MPGSLTAVTRVTPPCLEDEESQLLSRWFYATQHTVSAKHFQNTAPCNPAMYPQPESLGFYLNHGSSTEHCPVWHPGAAGLQEAVNKRAKQRESIEQEVQHLLKKKKNMGLLLFCKTENCIMFFLLAQVSCWCRYDDSYSSEKCSKAFLSIAVVLLLDPDQCSNWQLWQCISLLWPTQLFTY